jgi:hypothetical protein
MTRSNMQRFAVLAIAGAVGLAACDRHPTHGDEHPTLGTVEIIDRTTTDPQTGQNPVVATWEHGAGWDTDWLPELSHATEDHRTRVSLGVRMWQRDGEQIVLQRDGEHFVQYELAQGAPTGVINFDPALGLFHGDHVHIYGFEDGTTGETQIRFVLWHDDHAEEATAPIGFRVTD